jgi:hypothetical protein
MVTLEEVREKAAPDTFPRHVLDGCDTGLVLFAAGFHGCQDAIWLAEAGVRATCVDVDHGKLGEMVLAYPEGWEYVHGDVFAYTSGAWERSQTWDVVTIDCPTGAFERCARLASRWCDLARQTVVLGSVRDPELRVPGGWSVTETVHRSDYKGGTYWTVLQ